MSCRVLGRSVETGILGWVADRARRRRLTFLDGEIIETPRNIPARALFDEHGFEKLDKTRFRLQLGDATSLTVPEWFKLEDWIE